MTIKSDKWIIEKCKNEEMIFPYVERQIKTCGDVKQISYGVSSYGYDVRLASELKLFDDSSNKIINPKQFVNEILIDATIQDDPKYGKYFILPPHSFALGRTIESFNIPRNILVICLGKSTYARTGLIVNITPIEPEFRGTITLEFSNTTNLPIMLFANEGIAQFLFFNSDEECESSYNDRNGKYQNQIEITGPKI